MEEVKHKQCQLPYTVLPIYLNPNLDESSLELEGSSTRVLKVAIGSVT